MSSEKQVWGVVLIMEALASIYLQSNILAIVVMTQAMVWHNIK